MVYIRAPLCAYLSCLRTAATGGRAPGSMVRPAPRPSHMPGALLRFRCPYRKGIGVEHVRLGVHIWVSVLIMGTLWRLLQYHLVASDNSSWQHIGRAMALQY